MEIQSMNTMQGANQLFILCAEEDRDYVIALQKNLKARQLSVWSMFRDDGNYSVGIGDDHLQAAINELKKTCVVIFLISENSIRKGEDKASFIFWELNSSRNMKLIPICIEEDLFNRLPASWMPFGIDRFKMFKTLKKIPSPNGEKIDEKMLNRICDEISTIYSECMNANGR